MRQDIFDRHRVGLASDGQFSTGRLDTGVSLIEFESQVGGLPTYLVRPTMHE